MSEQAHEVGDPACIDWDQGADDAQRGRTCQVCRDSHIHEAVKQIAKLGGVSIEDAQKSTALLIEQFRTGLHTTRRGIPLCEAVADGVPAEWACQLGLNHGGPFHIYADGITMLKWANGPDGYVPDECPDPSAHGLEF